jgi:probable F420-dependent oxidoreductase
MEFGVVIPHTGRHASPEYVRGFCTSAEDAGFDGLWGVDHMVMPHHTDSLYLLGRNPAVIEDDAVSNLLSPNYEMITTLCWVAGFTSRIKLGTSVAVLPIRNAVANARQLSTLDVYSGGRVLYGVGVGWLREEAEAMGMPWDHRGRRSEEHIALLRALWCADGDLVEFHGEFHNLPPMDPEPRPTQRPIPILIGGHSDVALERAGRIGDGWIAAAMSPAPLAEHWARVREAAERNGRDPDALQFAAAMRPLQDRQLADAIAEYADVGVDHLIVDMHVRSRDEVFDELHRFGAEVAPSFRARSLNPGD